MSIFRQLQVPEDVKALYSTGCQDNRLVNLGKLNVFIGPNNCGKSRFLRSIFGAKRLTGAPAGDATDALLHAQSEFLRNCSELPLEKEYEPLRAMAAELQPPLHTLYGELTGNLRQREQQQRGNLTDQLQSGGFAWRLGNQGEQRAALAARFQHLTNKFAEALQVPKKIGEPIRIYIPTLRGLRPLTLDPNLYRKRTIFDYFKDRHAQAQTDAPVAEIAELDIHTGLELYDQVRKHLLGTHAQRGLIREYEGYLATHFFDGKEVTLTPRVSSDVVYLKIGREAEQPIFDLGDGLQQVIMLTLPIFLHRDRPIMLFVEEPETHLHPGFQRAFIDLVLSSKGTAPRQVFVTTQSNHFLDITLDRTSVSVYKFSKVLKESDAPEQAPEFRIANSSNDDFPLLAELGVRNSSVMLANCTIWVEGISDRLYFRRFLELCQEQIKGKFLEDVHFSFVEYGGNNVTHWSFLDDCDGMRAERLCGELLLIADRDTKKEERHAKLEKNLGERFQRLECREVENLLTPAVIRAAIQDREGDGVKFKEFKQSDYKDQYLGEFIEEHILEEGWHKTRKGRSEHPYRAESGTLKEKVTFARAAVGAMTSFDDLSDEAQKLTKRIYEFIKLKNAPAPGTQ